MYIYSIYVCLFFVVTRNVFSIRYRHGWRELALTWDIGAVQSEISSLILKLCYLIEPCQYHISNTASDYPAKYIYIFKR